MCLWINSYDVAPKVATEDIVCYKKCIIDYPSVSYISEYQKFNYYKLRTYINNIPLPKNIDTNFMLHFSNFIIYSSNIEKEYCLGKNLFHSFKKIPKYNINNREVALKCIIPKGTYYWENEKEYVSSQIKILEEL